MPGRNLFIVSCNFFKISSKFGGVGPLLKPPSPFPPPPGGGYHRLPVAPPPGLRRGGDLPSLFTTLGDTELWGQPYSDHLTLNMKFLDVFMLMPMKKFDWMMGISMRLIGMRSERWLEKLFNEDQWLLFRNWGEIQYVISNGLFRIQAGFRVKRDVEWGLSQHLVQSLWPNQPVGQPKQEGEKNPYALYSQAPTWLLPMVRVGLHIGSMSFELGGELLSWDVRGFRGDARLTFRGNGLKFVTQSTFTEEAARIANPMVATWRQQTWISKATLEINMLHFFLRNRFKPRGPVLFRIGVRYRHIFHHMLADLKGNALFQETPGGEWSVSAGLVIGFGMEGPSTF